MHNTANSRVCSSMSPQRMEEIKQFHLREGECMSLQTRVVSLQRPQKNQGCSLPLGLGTNLYSRINVHVLMALLTVMERIVSCIFCQHHRHSLSFLRLLWFHFFACFFTQMKEEKEILWAFISRDCDPCDNCKQMFCFALYYLEEQRLFLSSIVQLR